MVAPIFLTLLSSIITATMAQGSFISAEHNTTVLESTKTEPLSTTTTTSLITPIPENSVSCLARWAVVLSERQGNPQFVNAWKQGEMSEAQCRSVLGALGIEAVENINGPIALGQVASWDAPVIRPLLQPTISGASAPFDPYTRIYRSEPLSKTPGFVAPAPQDPGIAGSSPIFVGSQPQLNKANVMTTESGGRADPMTTMAGGADYVDVSAIPGGIMVGSGTLRPGAPPIVTLGKTFSEGEDGNLVIDNSQTVHLAQPTNMPPATVFRIGGQDLTGIFVAPSSGGDFAILLGPITIRPGSKTTYVSHTLSLASSGVLFDGTTPATTLPGTITATTTPAPLHTRTNMLDSTSVMTTTKKKSDAGRLLVPLPKFSSDIVLAVGTVLHTMVGWIVVL